MWGLWVLILMLYLCVAWFSHLKIGDNNSICFREFLWGPCDNDKCKILGAHWSLVLGITVVEPALHRGLWHRGSEVRVTGQTWRKSGGRKELEASGGTQGVLGTWEKWGEDAGRSLPVTWLRGFLACLTFKCAGKPWTRTLLSTPPSCSISTFNWMKETWALSPENLTLSRSLLYHLPTATALFLIHSSSFLFRRSLQIPTLYGLQPRLCNPLCTWVKLTCTKTMTASKNCIKILKPWTTAWRLQTVINNNPQLLMMTHVISMLSTQEEAEVKFQVDERLIARSHKFQMSPWKTAHLNLSQTSLTTTSCFRQWF